MNDNRKRILLGTTLLGCAALGLAWALGADPPRGPAAAALGPGDPSARRTLPPLRCALHEDDLLGYELRSSTVYSVAGGSGGAASRRETLRFDGRLRLRVREAAPARDGGARIFTLAALLDGATVSLAGERDRPLEAALAEPILVEMDESCRFLAIAARPGASARTRNQWRNLLKTIEVVLPAPGTARSWTATQSDGIGSYWATYSRLGDDGGPVEIRRSRRGYSQLHQGMGGRMSASIARTEAAARWSDEAGWLASADVHERVILSLDGSTVADAETTLRLTSDDHPRAADALLAAVDPADLVPTAADTLEQESPPLPFSERPPIEGLAARSLEHVLSDIEARLSRRPQTDFDGSLNLLVQYLRLDPARPAEALARLRGGGDDEDVRSMLFLGLALTGGDAAHEALYALARDPRLSVQDRVRALGALPDMPDPDAGTVEALLSLRGEGELGATATLSLGALARNAALDGEHKVRILSTLGEELAQGDGDPRAALAAAGNTGDRSLRDRVAPWTSDPDPTVQAEAYAALNKMNAAPPAGEVLDALETTSHDRTRSVLSESLAGAALSAEELARCAGLLEAQPPAKLRAVLIVVLGERADRSALAKAALVRQLGVEKDPALLTLLGRYLVPADLL